MTETTKPPSDAEIRLEKYVEEEQHRIMLVLPKTLWRKLGSLAVEQDTNRSEMLRRLIEKAGAS